MIETADSSVLAATLAGCDAFAVPFAIALVGLPPPLDLLRRHGLLPLAHVRGALGLPFRGERLAHRRAIEMCQVIAPVPEPMVMTPRR